MKRSAKFYAITAITTILALISVTIAAAAPTVIDLTTADAEVTWDGAIFVQGPLLTSAGTGVINPFLRVSHSNSDIEKGYNTDYRPVQFDEDAPWTKALLLSTVPIVEHGGAYYRELRLDINQISCGSGTGTTCILSLDKLRLFASSSNTLNAYDEATGTFGAGGTATLLYDLGNAYVKMNFDLEPGSGVSDVTFLIPESKFAAYPECGYGQSACSTYLTLFSRFGDNFGNNDGFEEWSTVIRPFVQVSKTANASYDRDYAWEIEKDVLPDTFNMFAGQTGTAGYTVKVTKTTTDSNMTVSGNITIFFPKTLPDGTSVGNKTYALVTSVLDQVGGTDAAVTCPTTTTLNPGDSITCTYTAALTSKVDGTNVAEVFIEGNGAPFYGMAPYVFGDPTKVTGYNNINVTDTNSKSWATGVSATWPYTQDFSCPTDTTLYTDGFYSFTHENTATITETGQNDKALVTVNCYAPVITKDAAGAYDEHHTWDIDKTVKPTSQDAFIGETVNFDWTVDLKETVTEDGFAVTGKVYVKNPHPTAPMTVTLSDKLDDGTVAVFSGCTDGLLVGDQLTVLAGKTATCAYKAEPLGREVKKNDAAVTLNKIDFKASADVAWTATVYDPMVTVDDDYNAAFPLDVTDGGTWLYGGEYTCSTDLTRYDADGKYYEDLTNLATVKSGTTLLDSDDATTRINCYIPKIEKDAAGAYDEHHTWDIDKTVKPTSQDAFIGETVNFTWDVTLTEKVTEDAFAVTGKIYVTNPNPTDALVVTLSDKLSDDTVAVFSGCTGGTLVGDQLTVPAGGKATCDYKAEPLGRVANKNTATIALGEFKFSDDADIVWTPTIYDPKVTVDDDYYSGFPLEVTDGGAWSYGGQYTCSTDLTKYNAEGTYTDTVKNVAEVKSGTTLLDSDDANTTINCYIPLPTKDAFTTFNRKWMWTIDKVGDQTKLTLKIGEQFTVNYAVTVTATKTDDAWNVTGTIFVKNPNPSAAMTVSVKDTISPDIVATLDCGGTLTIPAGQTGTCGYSATLPDGATRTNTAVITLNGVDFTAKADVVFDLTKPTNETDECINVTDDKYGALGTVCASESPKTFTYAMIVGPYQLCGKYQFPNIASFVTNDTGTIGSDNWLVDIDVPCAGCTLTPGYWKTHSNYGPAPYDPTWALLLPSGPDSPFFLLSPTTWYQVFWTTPQYGDAYYILAHAYMAAKLNILGGASSTPQVDAAIVWAENYFASNTPLGKIKPALRKDVVFYAGILDKYNNGLIGPGHCSEQVPLP